MYTVNIGVFSTGISWDYRTKEREVTVTVGWCDIEEVMEETWRDIDQSNNPLFVTPKYENLKQEIVNYQHINIDQYEKEILPKAEAFYETKLVRSMTCNNYEGRFNKYGITKDEIISKDRLISMILYTDYTELSSDFSSTFRRKTVFEPLTRTKKRHRNYYWMSKLLRETVAIYGQSNTDKSRTKTTEKLGGPFFCGMSMVMKMPQFAISLFSPTSTSCHLEVTIKFSGSQGIIVEFLTSTETNAQTLRGLDLSWLSRYKEEDER